MKDKPIIKWQRWAYLTDPNWKPVMRFRRRDLWLLKIKLWLKRIRWRKQQLIDLQNYMDGVQREIRQLKQKLKTATKANSEKVNQLQERQGILEEIEGLWNIREKAEKNRSEDHKTDQAEIQRWRDAFAGVCKVFHSPDCHCEGCILAGKGEAKRVRSEG